VTGCEPAARTSWRAAFLHCCRLWRGLPALPAWSGRFLSIMPHRPYQMELEFEPPPLDALLESESLPEAEAPLRARIPLAASVVAHTDRAGEFETYGFPATNALRHNGVLRQCYNPNPNYNSDRDRDRDRDRNLTLTRRAPAVLVHEHDARPQRGAARAARLARPAQGRRRGEPSRGLRP